MAGTSSVVKALLVASSFLGAVTADGLYPKSSAVLQVDGKSYNKLIAKSNMVSIVEFYAPWCGHCQNLKPAYEKAAKGLKDFAQVAAVNCDDDSNKAFCGEMGVQGFPTLKIIKPSKTPGRPSVEDYQGPRTASGIVDAVKSAIPNHVKRITDKGLDTWLTSDNETAKAFLFSEKGTTSALIKVLASEFLSTMKFAQIRNKEAAAVEMFGVEEYPTLFVLPGATKEAVKFEGSFTKESMKSFLSQFAEPGSSSSSSKKQKPLGKEAEGDKKDEKAKSKFDSSTFSEASSSYASAEASSEAAGATTITLEDDSNPTESPAPMADPDAPGPAKVPHMPEPIPALIEEKFLELQCLGPKTTTCILALLPQPTDDEESLLPDSATSALASLAEIADKHIQRGGKLFPFYSIPARNTGQIKLRDMLNLKDNKNVELVALNTRRGWWRHYETNDFATISVEAWVDAIRLGEGQKSKLPDGLVAVEEPPAPEHGEL